MTQGITQWTAGGLALRTIARWMIDGGDATQMREFIRWLAPSDVAQTEHLFIVDALRRLVDTDGELSLARLEAVIAQQDPAGFVRFVLQNIVENRQAGPSPTGPEFDDLVAILRNFRMNRDREAFEAKRNAVGIARRVLACACGVIDGARQLEWVEAEFQSEDRSPFAIFSSVANAVRDHPEGPVRQHWATDALAQKDAARARLELEARPDVEKACKALIDRWEAV